MKTLPEMIAAKISRRQFVKGVAAVTAGLAMNKYSLVSASAAPAAAKENSRKLISWGDNLFTDQPFAFSLESQLSSFGYNNDYIAFMPIDKSRALLGINHETPVMRGTGADAVDIALASMGASVIEIKKGSNGWEFVRGSKYNRRINAYDTEMLLTGPAGGKSVVGTFGNCAGGKTPWGTVLSCEENIDQFFTGKIEKHKRMGIGSGNFGHSRPRFDTAQNPDEPYKFGWVVEYDPYDPISKPKKRTALGRFKHESANTVLSADKRVVVYMGDDEAFEYLYKFVSAKPYDGKNRDLLDDGTLYVAKFSENGKLKWLPIPPEELLHTREAADKVGATPMDRPEDVEIAPGGNVYVACTKNAKRVEVNPANPRANNIHGHILELTHADHADLEGGWDIFVLGSEDFGCPDNIVFANDARMFVTTDGMKNDGLFLINEGTVSRVLSAPKGAEFTGPELSADNRYMFLSVQHPAAPIMPHVITFAI